MESAIERGPWLEEAFTKQGASYISYINTDGPMEFRITPREGYFDVEVSETTHEYEYEHDVIDGISVSYPVYDEIDEVEHLNSRELTVSNVETAVQRAILDPEWTLPESLAEKLIDWQEKYWDGNEIEKGYAPGGAEATEEISERLRLEFGSALAEAQGIANYESPKIAGGGGDEIARDNLAMASAEAGDINTSDRPGYTMEEWEQMMDRALDRRYEAGIDLMEAEGIRGAELELQREQDAQAIAKLERSSLSLSDDQAQEQSLELEDGEDHSISF